MSDFTLAELMISAAARAWAEDGELLATGVGPLPRLAASLCRLTLNDAILMTDGETFLVEDPVPLDGSGASGPSGWLPYHRAFEAVWSGRRHAMVTPVQIDAKAQSNISALGSFERPKVQMLGCRGFPGNSISHKNSFLVTAHDTRTFVPGEVDVVCSLGFHSTRFPAGMTPILPKIGLVVTPLCVMDYQGPDHAARVVSLHPGVGIEEVRANTGFAVTAAEELRQTPAPTTREVEIIAALDPSGIRHRALKGNPPGRRAG